MTTPGVGTHAVWLFLMGEKRNPGAYDAAGFWIKEWTNRVVARCFDGTPEMENVLRLSGPVDFNQVRLFLASPGLFHPHRVAILDRAEWAGKENDLVQYQEHPLPEATLIVIEDRPLPGLESRLPKSAVRAARSVGPRDFERFVGDAAERRGIKFSHEGQAFFLAAVDGNGWQALRELDKLSLLEEAAPRRQPWDADALGAVLAEPLAADGAFFRVTDTLLERRRARCLGLVQSELKNGVEPVVLLVMVVRQLIGLLHALEAGRGVSAEDFARQEGIKAYPAQKLLRAKKLWQAAELRRALAWAEGIDRALKHGQGEAAVWLEGFIAAVV